MDGWIGVFVIWFGMLVTVLALRRAARRHIARQTQTDLEDKTGGGNAPSAAWRELDTQQARRGAGHPLQ